LNVYIVTHLPPLGADNARVVFGKWVFGGDPTNARFRSAVLNVERNRRGPGTVHGTGVWVNNNSNPDDLTDFVGGANSSPAPTMGAEEGVFFSRPKKASVNPRYFGFR